MSLVERTIRFAESAPLPDFALRLGIHALVARTQRSLGALPESYEAQFARKMAAFPIAENTTEANEQHYEVPAEFFALVLGPRRKYSSCLYLREDQTLEGAEVDALHETAKNAALADGQDILELGCGWGSLSLFMAESYPNARITSVSNSHSQRRFIEEEASKRGLANLRVVTADMNAFQTSGTFDRVVSVEMFEHMANWHGLLARVRGWLKPEGKLFIHIFTHKAQPYRFDRNDKSDWIAQHFFTGGIMPSHGLIRQFPDLVAVEREWQWSGWHYSRTAEHWLENMDRSEARVMEIFRAVYGEHAGLWKNRWRMFFLATSGLFGYGNGKEWGVSHYLLRAS
jgi:cyclopropane-fatty-acyl-phospholipid synthase